MRVTYIPDGMEEKQALELRIYVSRRMRTISNLWRMRP